MSADHSHRAPALEQAGANPFLANPDGLTAYEEASVRGRNKLMKRMEESALFSGSVGIKVGPL